MDPLSLVASSITVAGLGVKVAHMLDGLISRWQEAETSIRGLQIQCQTFVASLGMLTQYIREEGVQSPTSSPFFEAVAVSIEGCAMFLWALTSELRLCKSGAGRVSKRDKALLLWNSARIKEYQDQLTIQTQGLSLLLQVSVSLSNCGLEVG